MAAALKEIERLNTELKDALSLFGESLEQQRASGDILRLIASSPNDVQQVFTGILDRALTLCEANDGSLFQLEGEVLRRVANRGLGHASAVGTQFSFQSGPGRAIRERRTIHFEDIQRELYWLAPELAENLKRKGIRTVLSAPLLLGQTAIGAILIRRTEVRPFSERQIRLLESFADQAVIAIENARLFNETKEALERQTATAEILRVIARSPTDVQPVFDAIAHSALHLIGGFTALVTQVVNNELHLRAFTSIDPESDENVRRRYPLRVADSLAAPAIQKRIPRVVTDSETDPEVSSLTREIARARGYRSILVTPMLRDDVPIGTIHVTRREAGGFSSQEIELVKTFADQAVIAIENVRLFNETKESLEQQTAISEVLRVISGSPTDIQPVLDAVAERAVRLCDGVSATLYLREGDRMRRVAVHGSLVYQVPNLVQPFSARSHGGRAMLEARTIHVHDIYEERETYPQTWDLVRKHASEIGLPERHSMLAAPLMKEGFAVGFIMVRRGEVRPFSDKQIELLKTFASQAVIAIENARLFNEIQEKSAQLEVANKHKSDFLAHMSHELRTPLNAVIGFSEVLMDKMFGDVNEKQLDYLKDIHESGKHLLSLINDILDLSKIEAGRMELEVSRFHMPTALSNAMTLVRERAQRHGIQLGSEIDGRLGDFAGDERKFKQIMLNLLSNAVKFTPDGGRVDVLAKLDTDKVLIAVTDTGVGIAASDQERLFEEFRQVGGDSGRKAEGTGLGLALTRRLVRLHGGDINVTSETGKGSTFTVVLPIRPIAVAEVSTMSNEASRAA